MTTTPTLPTLSILVAEGRKLAAKDINGKSDPYVMLWIGTKSKSQMKGTKKKNKTLKPLWNETFKFEYDESKYGENPMIKFRVWDYDRVGAHDFMGKVNIPFADVMKAPNTTLSGWFDLVLSKKRPKEEVSGSLRVEIKYKEVKKLIDDEDTKTPEIVTDEKKKSKKKT